MINPLDIFKIKAGIGNFANDHPKFYPFLLAVAAAGAKEGTIVEMKVTTPEGKELETNLRLTESDIELVRLLRELGGSLQKSSPSDNAQGGGEKTEDPASQDRPEGTEDTGDA